MDGGSERGSAADPYAVLGVGRDATHAQVRAAYRRLARQWHPDRPDAPPGAAARMAELNRAWAVLGDAGRRAAHDAGRFDVPFGDGPSVADVRSPVDEAYPSVLHRRHPPRGAPLRVGAVLGSAGGAVGLAYGFASGSDVAAAGSVMLLGLSIAALLASILLALRGR